MGTVTGRCVIWGAAPVGPSMLKLLRPGDHIIAADGGWVTARPRHPEGSIFTAGFPRYTPRQEDGEEGRP